jgi:uncharacterized membrane protein SpoIIM required for sporulation
MDYARFIRERAARWDAFEKALDQARREAPLSHGELEALAIGYRQILHDHALASARYAGTGAARRLERLAVEGTHFLQEDRAGTRFSVREFFTRRFPSAFRAHLPYLGVAAALFAVASFFGFTLGVAQPGVGFAILGPGAVEGLRQGRLWTESLVTTVPPSLSSSGIATNNMSVAITGWAGGSLLGLGSLWVIVLNGFMLGAIFAATWRFELAGELAEFVSAHGPLEITLILVTASGGLAIGHGLLAAQDRPRALVVQERSRQALVLLLGCLPWFLVLGLVEALVSPSPGLPALLKLAIGLGLEAVFLAWATTGAAKAVA